MYLPAILAACFSLSGCIDDLTGDDDDNSVSQADINYAKDFTRKFNDLDASMIDMEQPMTEAVQQFKADTEKLDNDAMTASMIALSSTTALALSIVKEAVTYSGEEVIGLDYSQFNSSYELNSLIEQQCELTCDVDFDLASSGTISYANNQLSVNDVLVTVSRYKINEFSVINGEWIEQRGDLIGHYDNQVSLTIMLPDEALNDNNEVSISVSNVMVQSAKTNFMIGVNRIGLDTQFDTGTNISLNDLFNLDAENSSDATRLSLAYELDNVELVLDQAKFNGNFNMNIDIENENNELGSLLIDFSVDGTLTNSLGDHILAKYSVNTGIDTNESKTAAHVGAEIGLTFHSQSSGDLTLAIKLDTDINASKDDIGEVENLELSMLNEIKIISGENGYIISYGLDGDVSESISSANAYIKILDATRSDKDFYIILNVGIDTHSPNGPEFANTSGVYVNDTLVGKWAFDQYENFQTITFSDEVIILGDSSIGSR